MDGWNRGWVVDVSLSVVPLELPLVHPFRIARGVQSVSHTALIRLRAGEIEALGESAPIARYGESVESVIAFLTERPPRIVDPTLLQTILDTVMPPAVRCGIDIALHDYLGKMLDAPLYRVLGLDPARTPVTSFTIGLDDEATTVRKVREIGDHPVVKVKLDATHHIDTVALIRSLYGGTLRIDANEAWSPDDAVRILHELERFDIEFCEQPVAAGHPEQLRYIRERTSIPIVADEDACDARDLPKLIGCVDGINVKLVKCGGIRGGLEMIHTARALGMKIMLGCMVESAVLSTAAAHLSPLVDWADLDGPFLIARDPFSGLTYERGKIVLPDAPGLGVREAA